jgi:predicted O-methyltransferase YrrM
MAEFTADWFSANIGNFTHVTNNLKLNLGTIDNVLEIGAHEGRATCWMLQNMLSDTGTMTCVDPFANHHVNPFNGETATKDRTWEKRFRTNTAEVKKPKQKLNVHVALSFPTLAQFIVDKKQFDFIYIDGNHCCDAVMADAVMAWSLLKPGGIILFDDYLFEDEPDVLDRGKMAIDAFINCFVRQIDWYTLNYQIGIGKKKTVADANYPRVVPLM